MSKRADVSYSKDYFKYSRWLFIMSGLYTPNISNRPIIFAYIIYKCYVLFGIYFIFTISELLSLMDSTDLYETSDMLRVAIMHIATFCKAMMGFFKGKQLFKTLHDLELYELRYRISSSFNPAILIRNSKKKSDLALLLFHIVMWAGFFSLFVVPLNEITGALTNGETNRTHVYTIQPIRSRIPFSYDTKLKNYILMNLYEAMPAIVNGHTVSAVDGLFIIVMIYIECHLKIIEESFKSIRERALQTMAAPEDKSTATNLDKINEIMMEELNITTEHLQVLLSVSKKLNGWFMYPSLAQFLISAIAVCLTLILTAKSSVGSQEFSSYGIYLIACYNQLFWSCWFGNKITVQALKIPDSIWESDWVEASKAFKMSLMVNMHITQQPFYFSIGKFVPITLNVYVSFVKMSYSYFTILSNFMNEKN